MHESHKEVLQYHKAHKYDTYGHPSWCYAHI